MPTSHPETARSSDSQNNEALTKEEAAQFLGVSPRALERYTAAGRLTVNYQRGKTRSVAVYEKGELERLQNELQRPTVRASQVEEPAPGETSTTPTRTATTATEEVREAEETSENRDRKREFSTPTNPDTSAEAEADELAMVDSGRAGDALEALSQLVLQRLIERAGGNASGSSSPQGGPSSTALVVASTAFHSRANVSVSPGEKLLLSLPEAAALTGLSRVYLRSAIRDGALQAKTIGRLWRIKRTDLDAFIAAL